MMYYYSDMIQFIYALLLINDPCLMMYLSIHEQYNLTP